MTVEIRPAGDAALLVTVADQATAHRLAAVLDRVAGVVDAVVGSGNVLVLVDPLGEDIADAVSAAATRSAAGEAAPVRMRDVEIPVVYDGEDLAEVAERTGLSVADVIRRHADGRYTVDFIGFSPGFGYLSGLDAALHLPRRDTPRPRVPAGTVAIAADMTCIYPQATPGGWWLIGRTDAVLFDPERDPPALLTAGDAVRFAPAP